MCCGVFGKSWPLPLPALEDPVMQGLLKDWGVDLVNWKMASPLPLQDSQGLGLLLWFV